MTLADLYLGLGSLVYALARADGLLQPREIALIRDLLRREPHGDVALCSFTVREYHHDTVEEAYEYGVRCLQSNPGGLTPERRQHFLTILEEVARIDGHVCAAESSILTRFKTDFPVTQPV